MKNFILCLVACCTFLMCGMEVNAAERYVDYAEPAYGDNCGYIILEYASGSIATYFWSAYSQSEYLNDVESVDTGMSIVIDDSKVTFNILTDINIDEDVTNVTTYYTFSRYKADGTLDIEKSGSVVDKNPTYTYTASSSARIVGFSYKGNVSMITNQLDQTPTSPVLVFGDDPTPTILNDILSVISQDSNLFNTYMPKLNDIAFSTTQMYQLLTQIKNDIQTYYPTFNTQLQDINDSLWELKEYILNEPNADDQQKIDDFENDSSSQSDRLNALNHSGQTTKPNINNMSNTVDNNLNMDIDANYGLLLSAFTSNNRILTMLLIVASVSLVSYVFFGKR